MYGSAENRDTGQGVNPLVIVLNNKMKVPKSPPLGGLTVSQ
jgi:hypothetical protein